MRTQSFNLSPSPCICVLIYLVGKHAKKLCHLAMKYNNGKLGTNRHPKSAFLRLGIFSWPVPCVVVGVV